MKHLLSTALALVCIALVISLVVTKRGDNVQRESDAGAVTDFSNRLDSAQIQIATYRGAMLTLSNYLDESRVVSLTLSNHLAEAGSTVARDTEQITNLTRQVAEVTSENQALRQHAADLTNQLADLTSQIALTGTRLAQANMDYALLENRLRRDVAERAVVERKFYNLSELQAQMEKLKNNPGGEVSAGSIYAGLDVEVTSNGVHVISPN